ncbi:MAG: short-chain dehydrogenase [Alteromonadaceae bacterium]|nr:short-chain dehydrogenase [Alteromonadaceae bacterium]
MSTQPKQDAVQSDSQPAGQASFWQLFAYPFRIFFMSLAVVALVAVPLWVGVVTGAFSLPLALPGVFWHQHEMIFGFLSAAIAGFLLTAVCVWTQTERTHGIRLLMLWLVWLGGRLLLLLGADMPDWLVHGVNLAFLPLVMLDAGWRVWHARQHRQLMLLVVLGLLWVMQVGFVIRLEQVFIHGALVMSLALISIVGGRITPAFTISWLRQRGGDADAVQIRPRLDKLVLATMVALLVAVVLELVLITGVLAAIGALLTLVRLAGWKGWLARQEPLLWILHLSILWVPVALALLAGVKLLDWPATAWAHAAGTGAIGSLILGVIARVSLGHSGRPMVLPGGMVLAFVLIQAAALIRVLTALEVLPWAGGVHLSTVLWIIAYGIFAVRYFKVLASPRADGRPG